MKSSSFVLVVASAVMLALHVASAPVFAVDDDIELDDDLAGTEIPKLHHSGWFSFQLPRGYEPANGKAYAHLNKPAYIKRGGRQALKRALPKHEITKSVRRRWLEDDQRAFLTVSSRPLSTLSLSRNRNRQSRQVEICKRIMGHWSRSSISLFDETNDVGRCIDYDGTFVAVFTREVDNYLVMIEAVDFVEFLVWKEMLPGHFETLSTQSKWWGVRRAANALDAEFMIRSVRKRSTWTAGNATAFE